MQIHVQSNLLNLFFTWYEPNYVPKLPYITLCSWIVFFTAYALWFMLFLDQNRDVLDH